MKRFSLVAVVAAGVLTVTLQPWAMHAVHAFDVEQRRDKRRAGGARRHKRSGAAVCHRAGGLDDRRVLA